MIVGRVGRVRVPAQARGRRSEGRSWRSEELSGDGFKGVSFDVRRGEIIGLAGIVGNGQSEFLRALAGLEPATGTVSLAGGHCASAIRRRAPASRTCRPTGTARAC